MSDRRNLTPLILLISLSLIWGTSFILIIQGLKVFSGDEVGALRELQNFRHDRLPLMSTLA